MLEAMNRIEDPTDSGREGRGRFPDLPARCAEPRPAPALVDDLAARLDVIEALVDVDLIEVTQAAVQVVVLLIHGVDRVVASLAVHRVAPRLALDEVRASPSGQ